MLAKLIFAALLTAFALGAGAPALLQVAPLQVNAVQPAGKPALPFPDNVDSRQCSVPTPLGDAYKGELNGRYKGRLVEPLVRLYDGHSRARVVAHVPSGTRAQGVLLVAGPQLNYLLVRARVNGVTVEGWVPEPYFRTDAP